MTIWNWLNHKRLRDYPRLVLIASGIVILLNVLLSHGWIGGLTGILMFGDFVDYYSAGILYKTNIAQLYNPAVQESSQLRIISPTIPPGVTFYSYPPNAALFHAIFSYLSLPICVFFWCLLSIYCVILAAKLMHRFLVPEKLAQEGLSPFQISIIIFSSFAFTEGFAAGQMHSITLLLMVAVLIATIKEKWVLAGVLAAGLTFKPQFALGFLLLWLIWKKFSALFTFILFSSLWNGIVLATKGINPYLDYINLLKDMIYLPSVKEGFPNAILSTPYTLIASMIPIKYASSWNLIYLGIIILFMVIFVWLAYKTRKLSHSKQNILLSMTMILPLLITPYTLLHDLLVLFPVMILMSKDHEQDKGLLLTGIGVYMAMLVLPLLSYSLKIALTGLIPLAVFIFIVQRSFSALRTRIPQQDI